MYYIYIFHIKLPDEYIKLSRTRSFNMHIYIHIYIYIYIYIYQSVKAQGTIQKIEKINVKSVNALIKVSQFMLKSKKSE